MDIAFFVDRNMLSGLHVTLYSCLLHYRGQSRPCFHVFHEGLEESDVCALTRTLDKTGKDYQLTTHEFVPRLEGFRSLHGSFMTYGRIFLPSLLSDRERVLYLDSDLLICCDVSPLWSTPLDGCAIGAVSGGKFDTALERDFFRQLGINLKAACFNAGVLVLDLNVWRQYEWTNQCLEFGAKYGAHLRAADQTLLNAVFYQNFQRLPLQFNKSLEPTTPAIKVEEQAIYHFIGSPKPFDLSGRWLHNNYDLFRRYLAQTAVGNDRQSNLHLLPRTLRICRSIWRTAKTNWFHRRQRE